MNWPPFLMKLQFRNQTHNFSLWLPLFLIWPIVLVFVLIVFLILLPFALLALIFTWQIGWWRPVILGIPAVCRVFYSLRGTIVDVAGQDNCLKIELR